jgi:hypothetical protein
VEGNPVVIYIIDDSEVAKVLVFGYGAFAQFYFTTCIFYAV